MSSLIVGGPRRMNPNKSPWIISKAQDLVWFQGTVLIGIALLLVFRAVPDLDAASYSAGHPAVIVLFLWGIMLDGTHVWATYARTFFAPDQESRSGLPSSWAWGVIAVG